MVKYSSLAIGLILFSLFASLIFSSASIVGQAHNSTTHADFNELAGDYDDYAIKESSEDTSTFRQVGNKTVGGGGVISTGSDILLSAVDGVKLFFGSIAVSNTVLNQIEDDTNGAIHPLFKTAIISIITIIIVIIVISMFMRFKPET